MDINDDGIPDILSGSYSRMDQDMAGLFQVLYGIDNDDGGFKAATPLKGTDGEPLIIPGGERERTEKICTRPTAADVDGDGDLDLVVGNFSGTFYLFTGEGNGKFAPEPEKMMTDGKELKVPQHSDPFLVDWDGDSDLDMLSGSASGGVFLSINEGTRSNASFTPFEPLIEPVGMPDRNKLGDKHLNGPQQSTRVWADDLNGDGKLDLLVGDSVRLRFAAEGLNEREVQEKIESWQSDYNELSQKYTKLTRAYQEAMKRQARNPGRSSGKDEPDKKAAKQGDSEDSEQSAEQLREARQRMVQKMAEMYQKKSDIVREQATGFVWVYYQK